MEQFSPCHGTGSFEIQLKNVRETELTRNKINHIISSKIRDEKLKEKHERSLKTRKEQERQHRKLLESKAIERDKKTVIAKEKREQKLEKQLHLLEKNRYVQLFVIRTFNSIKLRISSVI